MIKIHRLARPPRSLHHQRTVLMSDMVFDEDQLILWARDSLSRDCQYDITRFNGTKGRLNQIVELTMWFGCKRDASDFESRWMR